MRLSIRTKQVLGVTALVTAVVIGLSVQGLAQLANVRLQETQARADLLAHAIYQRSFQVVPTAPDPYAALAADGGLRAILESSIYSPQVTDAAIVAPDGRIVAHLDRDRIGMRQAPAARLQELVLRSGFEQLWRIFGEDGRTYEVVEPLRLGDQNFGTINIGVSTLLIRKDLEERLQPVLVTALWALAIAMAGALALAQWLLRPIHVLRSGLRQLERGEPAAIELPQDEFGDLGREIKAVSDKLLAERAVPAGPQAGLDSIVEHLADAVGIFGPGGELLFANPTLRALLRASEPAEPFADIVDRTRESRASADPLTLALASGDADGSAREWHVTAHPVEDRDRRLVGVMVVARDLAALGEVESTLRYSRKLAALGRLTAGVAHEVKNPLNAMTIHLELLKGKLAPARAHVGAGADVPVPPMADQTAALEHVSVIGGEIRRLDQVVQGFLKFMRPEDLKLQPVNVGGLLQSIARVVEPDAAGANIRIVCDCPPDVPWVHGDPEPLRQALFNLAINACQAMPNGGTLRLSAQPASGRRVALTVEDTGVGIPPAHLSRIFDLYYTTRAGGSGIGLSMVFRTIQLHDGQVEVQSTPGIGTTFRILLPQATSGPTVLGLR
jgi:signal transduction histidine kinase/HAMP domain-containing protein